VSYDIVEVNPAAAKLACMRCRIAEALTHG
jgi:hypothetical protein